MNKTVVIQQLQRCRFRELPGTFRLHSSLLFRHTCQTRPRPINIFVDTYGRSHVNMTDGEIARVIDQLFDLRPKAIEERLKLRNPIYQETAAYGHMGREPQVITKKFFSRYEGDKTVEVELFTWEKLDYVDKIKAAFGL